ncbi:maleylpyruvate isomerase family mycothiol-dependent enzyme [Actinomadura litoris]|uniref:Maleylpyruvate isomerase family mycothiol-dependent enzyme n=1 Tax=Actinomadura litoris TaxID=2678616 RepID=A0A7K1KXB9_9ACTN|nr:maleylpyruvate isomerase family mycothiol-dependent enzyme [Actinomadura litoris]MUN36625.1 maleylpyruvate isomerase family mycothiol-dependent enzyme [Actinomadura litoris]
MSPVHEHVASLLGSWALGACSDEETRLVMGHVPHCPACMEESLLLGGVAGLLDGVRPGASLRERTLAGARARRRPVAPSVPSYAAPYAALVSMLDALLAELSRRAWSTNVIYDWSVQDVVAHLSATDSLLAEQLNTQDGAPVLARAEPAQGADARDVDARTALVIDEQRGRGHEETRVSWRAQADALCARLDEEAAAIRVVLKFPMRTDSAVVARAFETWVHARDIATATGHSLPPPPPEHLHAIATLGVRALPGALALREGRAAAGESVHVDLRGPGGGAWHLPLGPSAPDKPTVTLALDTMDFCLLAAERLRPGEIRVDVGGDVPLGRRILAAASAFAGP